MKKRFSEVTKQNFGYLIKESVIAVVCVFFLIFNLVNLHRGYIIFSLATGCLFFMDSFFTNRHEYFTKYISNKNKALSSLFLCILIMTLFYFFKSFVVCMCAAMLFYLLRYNISVLLWCRNVKEELSDRRSIDNRLSFYVLLVILSFFGFVTRSFYNYINSEEFKNDLIKTKKEKIIEEHTFIVDTVLTEVHNNETHYYFITQDNKIFNAAAHISDELILTKKGDSVKCTANVFGKIEYFDNLGINVKEKNIIYE